MTKQTLFLICIVVGFSYISGCSKNTSLPLSAGECKQMKDKQLSMMVAELPKEYQATFDPGSIKADLDCGSLKDQARAQYQCTMSAGAMKDVEKCLAEKSKN